MLFLQTHCNDKLLTESEFVSGLHYYRDGDDIVFTYKDSSKRPKLHFRYPEGFLRAQALDGGGAELFNPIEGLEIPEATTMIANLKSFDMRLLFGTKIAINKVPNVMPKDVGAEITVNFDIGSRDLKYMLLSVQRNSNGKPSEEEINILRQLKADAFYTDEHKPSGVIGRSITRFVLPFPYSTEPVDWSTAIGMFFFEIDTCIKPIKKRGHDEVDLMAFREVL